jgi:exopolysaccharide biosynthesis polyprenyl glycosylphosphotransferase
LTHAIEPQETEVRGRKVSITGTAERAISLRVQADVALHQTKGGTARRHLVRSALRVLSSVAGDVAAAALAATLVRTSVAGLPAYLGLGPAPYASASEFCGALVIALALTGNYRRAIPHPTLTLLIGCTLGTIVVGWSSFWSVRALGVIPVVLLLALVTTGFLFLTRVGLTAFAAWLLPDHRRLVPAIAISSVDAHVELDQTSGYRLAGHITVDRRPDELRAQELARMIRQARAESIIVFGSIESRQWARCLEISLNAGCEVLCTPPGYGSVEVRPRIIGRGPSTLIQVQPPTLQASQVVAKRCVDVVGACASLVVTAPLWLLVGLLIKLDSPGPVFFSQERVGLGGRRFRMLKFRTMRVGAASEREALQHLNASGDPRVFKILNDPRISRVGGFLRRWSLDELPQFLNVIAGSMSLVGPRPVPEEDFVDYEDHHFRRLGAKPGITGLWQVKGRSDLAAFEERVRLDTEYIDQWSLWLDLKILLSTIPAVIRRTGAY